MFDFLDTIIAAVLEAIFLVFGIKDEAVKMRMSSYVTWGIIAFLVIVLAGLFFWVRAA